MGQHVRHLVLLAAPVSAKCSNYPPTAGAWACSNYLCTHMGMSFAFTKRLAVLGLWAMLLLAGHAVAQPAPGADTVADSQQAVDTATTAADLLPPTQVLKNPFIQLDGPLQDGVEKRFTLPGKELWFYMLLTLLLLLGAIRGLFWKYFADLFQIFSQSSFRQKSIREQLLQNRTASLALNLFFGLSAGLFLYQVAVYKGWLATATNWYALGLCVALVLAVYGVKYITLKASGWLLSMTEPTDAYVFIVFLMNKLVGILVLPATILLAFGGPQLKSVVLVITGLVLVLIYLYRFFVALPLVTVKARGSGFHFFIYLCAFEIMPMLMVYKVLMAKIA
ncbi:MAG: DUF4271 domain-containing protein [Bacteroidetes bacterium]|nr:MAG: DUF4271 domain-containing protein [Bacteroidota bacterium]